MKESGIGIATAFLSQFTGFMELIPFLSLQAGKSVIDNNMRGSIFFIILLIGKLGASWISIHPIPDFRQHFCDKYTRNI